MGGGKGGGEGGGGTGATRGIGGGAAAARSLTFDLTEGAASAHYFWS